MLREAAVIAFFPWGRQHLLLLLVDIGMPLSG
jgi:hypothetical protein